MFFFASCMHYTSMYQQSQRVILYIRVLKRPCLNVPTTVLLMKCSLSIIHMTVCVSVVNSIRADRATLMDHNYALFCCSPTFHQG